MSRVIRVIRVNLPEQFPVGSSADFARLSQPNVFQRENTFSGIRLGQIKIITAAMSPFTVLPIHAVILADCSDGEVDVVLPPSTGNGQLYRLRKIDLTDNPFVIQPQSGDLIDIYPGITLTDYRIGMQIEDGDEHFWDIMISPFIAYTDVPNFFTDVQTLSGLRLGQPRVITGPYEIQRTDFEILVDCSVNDIDIPLILPPSEGNCQTYHIKKIDVNPRVVSINPRIGDSIGDFPGDSISVNFSKRGEDAWIIDAAPGYWDNTGPSNILTIPDDPPTVASLDADAASLFDVATKVNEIISLLNTYGLSQ